MMDIINFGSKQIFFHIQYSNRKSLGITVTPDLKVLVKAPVAASLERVKEKLYKKAPWIIRQQSFFLSFHPKTPARKFVTGETHLYLGRQYRLKILKGNTESVKLKGQFIEVLTPDKANVKQLVDDWYFQNAKAKFLLFSKPLIQSFLSRHNVEKANPKLQTRFMPTRWGSCTAKGKIILNPELVKAPRACIEYVIIHELCHLVHHDHTQKFIDLQTKEMPDWEKWKMKLEKLLA